MNTPISLVSLNNKNLSLIAPTEIDVLHKILHVSDKVIQFGTGVLLRSLPDYYIDKANKNGIFNGRIIVVKTTSNGSIKSFQKQDNLYTHCLRGMENGALQSVNIINTSISKVLEVSKNWSEIISCASNPEIKIIISNTTEAGIVLDKNDRINKNSVPVSFPGKLLSFLHKRFTIFDGSFEAGMVIIPTELITDNGKTLLAICLQLASIQNLGNEFSYWLQHANDFCNSLVDRIVPGRPEKNLRDIMQQELGYFDELLTISETYGLWAIETSKERTRNILSFAKVDSNVIICNDIRKYKDLKLYLLNATHTFLYAAAILKGFEYVKDTMQNDEFIQLTKKLLFEESVPAVTVFNISKDEAEVFAQSVIDRFSNPFLEHKWKDISIHAILKIRTRCIPLIAGYYNKFHSLPHTMINCFAACLLYIIRNNSNREPSLVKTENDKNTNLLLSYWDENDISNSVKKMLSDSELWSEDISHIERLAEAVTKEIESHTKRFL